MGFLMFLSRKIDLQNRENNISYQLTTINEKLSDYTSFASILQQDSIDLTDISNLPSSLFEGGLREILTMNQQAAQMSQVRMNEALQTGLFNGITDQNAMNYAQVVAQQRMYENARKQLQKQLAAKLNEEEKHLQATKTRLETQLTAIQKEEESCTQQISNGIKNQISGFGLQG